jgi:hypothetical protein
LRGRTVASFALAEVLQRACCFNNPDQETQVPDMVYTTANAWPTRLRENWKCVWSTASNCFETLKVENEVFLNGKAEAGSFIYL